MCLYLSGNLPQEIATKRQPLVLLYGTFFGLSILYSILIFLLPLLWIGKIQDYYFPVVLLYNIIESSLLFCCKRFNIFTTILFRSLIGVNDCVDLILNIMALADYFHPMLIWKSLFHLYTLITNCSLLFLFARFPRKGPWYLCNHIE